MKKTLQECGQDFTEAWGIFVSTLADSFGIKRVLDFLTKILKRGK